MPASQGVECEVAVCWEARWESGSTLNGLMAKARRAAQRRGQRASTVHLLLAMLQEGGREGALLGSYGISENDLLSALKVVDAEAGATFDRTLEHSQQIAQQLGSQPSAVHLLLAITRDPRTAGHRSLTKLGKGPARVHAELLDGLREQAEAAPAPVAPRRPRMVQASREWMTRGRPRSSPKRTHTSGTHTAADRTADESCVSAMESSRDTSAERSAHGTGDPSETTTHGRLPEPTSRAPGSRDGDSRQTEVRPPKNRRKVPSARPTARHTPSRSRRDGANAEARVVAKGSKREQPPASVTSVHLDPQQYPLLSRLGRNLSALAADGALDPVIGREDAIDRLLDVLGRRRANNPVLVGPPGVGKTAVVEGLAQRLSETSSDNGGGALHGRVIIEMSAGALVTGTGVRGALAQRLKQLREEVTRSGRRIVLFIDEIHGIVGGDGGPDDLAHELKAALARGELPCIGATTEREYRLRFEKDPALTRRFSPIHLDEPSAEDSYAILGGIKERYEEHHGLPITSGALRAAVDLTSRYLTEGHLPDKAIGALDLASARARRQGSVRVDRASVAHVVAERVGLPVARLMQTDADRLLRLEECLAQTVVGHEPIRRRVADTLRKGAAGLYGQRPMGTFLFLGPTGVGKTLLAGAIAEAFYPGSPITRIDMSELGDRHSSARLLGAPPGYVGHDAGGQLTESVRQRPHQLVLLDEMEKAHPDVLLTLLPLLDEGRLTDGRGRTVDFTHTVVVMTSNLGVSAEPPRSTIGFGADRPGTAAGAAGFLGASIAAQEAVMAAARAAMPPELWNRIDEPLVFAPLERDEVAEVAARMLRALVDRLAERSVGMEWEPSAVEALLEAGGYDPSLGARPMRRTVGRLIEAPIAAGLLAGDFGEPAAVRVRGESDRLVVEPAAAAG